MRRWRSKGEGKKSKWVLKYEAEVAALQKEQDRVEKELKEEWIASGKLGKTQKITGKLEGEFLEEVYDRLSPVWHARKEKVDRGLALRTLLGILIVVLMVIVVGLVIIAVNWLTSADLSNMPAAPSNF